MKTNSPLTQSLEDLVQLSRLALTGSVQDVQTYVRRLAKRLKSHHPEVSSRLESHLASSPDAQAATRSAVSEAVIPRDADSRLELVKTELSPQLEVEPIWAPAVASHLKQIVQERFQQDVLADEGLLPTRSVLLTGRPGVGKSLAARWIARELKQPLVTLDLSAVMSSFLGKTGTNVKHVLNYAKSIDCVLFLDELDAVAKRRDDATEIGELKRLVTVLLQEIDGWPATSLLLAATNHPDLLDPAVWRRFDVTIEFPMPVDELVQTAVRGMLGHRVSNQDLIEVVSLVFRGSSFSDIAREVNTLVKHAVLAEMPIEDVLRDFVRARTSSLDLSGRKLIASCLLSAGFNQRETHEWTGVHRYTLRKMSLQGEVENGREAELPTR